MNSLSNYLSPMSLSVCVLIFILLACDKEDEERELMNMASQSAGSVQIDTGINVIGLGLTGQLKAHITQEKISAQSTTTKAQSTARVNQQKTSKPAVKWSSSDESIATVDEKGLVKGLAPGEVTITATSLQNKQMVSQKEIRVTDGQSDIKSFIINGVAGSIDGTNIIVALPAQTDVTALQPEIKHTGMAIRPGNKEPQDFTKPVTYAVYGRDRSVTKWNAIVTTEAEEENTDGAFVTTWEAEEITIPTDDKYEYNYSVDWNNDGIMDETGITGDVTHTFAEEGEHTIRITGAFPAIKFGKLAQEEADKIISVDYWGNIEWRSMFDAFAGCTNLTVPATDVPDLSKTTRTARMFRDAPLVNPDVSQWDVSNVRNMNAMFNNASSANPDVSQWNFSQIVKVSNMFRNTGLSQENYEKALIRLAAHDSIPELSLAENMVLGQVPSTYCNPKAKAARALLISKGWTITDEGESTDCEVELDGFITTWVGKEIFIPINTTEDFTYNYNVDWDNDGTIDQTGITGDVTHTFAEEGEHTIRIIGTFPAIRFGARVGEVVGPYWNNAAKITSVDQWGDNEWLSFASAFKKCVNLELKATDVPDLSKVTSLSGMFSESGIGSYDFSNWNTSNITNMNGVFAYTHNATQLNVSNWNTSRVTKMDGMFVGAASNPDVSNWNTSKVIQMGVVFGGAANANPDLSKWDFSSVGGGRPTMDIVDIINASGISQENYEKFLIRLAAHDREAGLTLAENIKLGNVPVTLCSEEAQESKALLLSKGWTIEDQGVDPACQAAPAVVPEFRSNLSELNLYEGNMRNLEPSTQVFEYKLNTPLFTDYAHKQRLLALPAGTSMSSNGDGLPDYPDNTVITKTFYYYNDERNPSAGKQIIETRVLIKKNGNWVLGNYVWNDAQTDASLTSSGSTVDMSYINSEGETINIGYQIPSGSDCFTCHQSNNEKVPIGPKLRNLNGTYHGQNQLQALIDRGWLSGISSPGQVNALPKWDNPNETDEFRARAYLEVNCAHCHTDGGFYEFINFSFETPFHETPLSDDYYQGAIPQYIESGYMPKIGTTLVHEEGLDVIKAYIENLE